MRRTHIWLFLALLAVPSRAYAEGCEGLLVTAVEIEGCGEGRCGKKKVLERLVSLTDLESEAYDEDVVDQALDRFLQTGYFVEVDAECTPGTGVEATVVFNVSPSRYIDKVEIEGTNVLYLSELEKRLYLGKGSVFNPGKKSSREQLERQLSTLETYVRKQGLDSAKITAETVLREPDLVDIIITVDEGRVTRVGSVDFVIDGPWGKEDVPEQYQCPRLKERELSRIIDVGRGDLYTNRTARSVKKAVRSFVQQYGFQSPRIKVKFDAETEVLNVSVRVSRCYSILLNEREDSEAYGAGYVKVDNPELFAALPFRESGILDQREAQRGIEELQVYYRLRGFLFAQIEMQFTDYRTMYPGWPYPLIGGVVYRITRGQPAEIREISFEGNKAFSDEELTDLIGTRRYDFFDVGGFLQVEQLFGDLDSIRSAYWDQGYFRLEYPDAPGEENYDMRVLLIRQSDHAIYRYVMGERAFDVIKPDWENAVRIVIRINEGEGSRLKTLRLKGMSASSPDDLALDLPLQPGGPFSSSLVRASVYSLEEFYRELGYSMGTKVTCRGYEPEVAEDECDVEKVRSLRVDVTISVDEGARHLMGEFLVVGNLKTRWGVIERDFPRQGEPLDRGKVDEAMRRLRNLGVFSSVRLITIGEDEEPPREKVALVVRVEEAATKFTYLSFGFQTMQASGFGEQYRETDVEMHPLAADVLSSSLHNTGAPLSGSASFQGILFPDVLLMTELSYSDYNFMGLGKTVSLPVSYGMSTTNPFRYFAFTPSYIDRRFLSSDFTMRVTPLYIDDRVLKALDTKEYGVETQFSRPLLEGIFLSLRTKLSNISWVDPDTMEEEPYQFQVEASPTVRFDWRDNPINPTSGTLVWTSVSYINAAAEAKDGTRSRENFWKYELGTQLYLSFRKALVLATNVHFGDSVSEGGGNLPDNQRFLLGGTNGMRGFPSGGVLQYQEDAEPQTKLVRKEDVVTLDDGSTEKKEWEEYEPVVGGDTVVNGSVELRFPLVRASGLWAASFVDVGALSDGLSQFHGNSFRFSMGAGIRWLIGGTIPLRLDYGFVLDRRCGDVNPADGSCLVKEEPGALDFGLLYSF